MLRFLVLFIFVLVGCTPEDTKRGVRTNSAKATSTATKGAPTGSNTELPTNGSVNTSSTSTITTVEIVNFVDPFNGTMGPKLTLPKNFNGYLSIQGINIGTLASKRVALRFKFGLDRAVVEVPASINTAPGLTPQSNIQVVTISMKSKPFAKLGLYYDLYDYTDYASTGTTIVSDNRNKKLYCRGLRLDDQSDNFGGEQTCTGTSDTCLYAYAKIVDKGLVRYTSTSTFPLTPTTIQTDNTIDPSSSTGNGYGYYQTSNAELLKRCLPERPDTSGQFTFVSGRTVVADPLASPTSTTPASVVFTSPSISATTGALITSTSTLSVDSVTATYSYEGAYRSIHYDARPGFGLWELPSWAIFGSKGLFASSIVGTTLFNSMMSNSTFTATQAKAMLSTVDTGSVSYLFPRYGQMALRSGVSFWGSASELASTATATKSVQTLNSNGTSYWMDGCNLRVQTMDPLTLEHVGSCNVSAEISLVVYDQDGNELNYGITSKSLKLQLVKPNALDADGSTLPDVLFSSFKNCSSSNQCGTEECCYNNRCWDKSYVSKCPEDTTSFGNAQIGQACTSDYQCSSLCCDASIGRCRVHDPTNTATSIQPICSKPIGAACVSKDYCQKVNLTEYLIVTLPPDALGNAQCKLQGFNHQVYADCKNGVCVNPAGYAIPSFDPNDANRCANAVTAPSN